MNGSEQEAVDFLNWFCDLPHPQKIFICGNHDDCLYGATIEGLDDNVHYLCNSGAEIEEIQFGTIFSNGAIMNADYSDLREPNLIDL